MFREQELLLFGSLRIWLAALESKESSAPFKGVIGRFTFPIKSSRYLFFSSPPGQPNNLISFIDTDLLADLDI